MKLADRRMLTTTDGLSTSDLAQLSEIGLYFGSVGPVTIDDDFAGDQLATRVLSVVDVWKVVDNGAHTYDLWQYMSDSGTMFRAGTTRVVAEIIQEGIECDDDALGQALDEAIAESRKKPATAKKAAAKSATKPASKNSATKKPAAKSATKKSAPKKPTAKAVTKKPSAKAAAKKKATKRR